MVDQPLEQLWVPTPRCDVNRLGALAIFLRDLIDHTAAAVYGFQYTFGYTGCRISYCVQCCARLALLHSRRRHFLSATGPPRYARSLFRTAQASSCRVATFQYRSTAGDGLIGIETQFQRGTQYGISRPIEPFTCPGSAHGEQSHYLRAAADRPGQTRAPGPRQVIDCLAT